MADEVRRLSDELARDPGSHVFVPLGEALRRRAQLDLALKVTLRGLERHPHFADAHDLLARISVDRHDLERAFDEWDVVLRLVPGHLGALKGMGFVCFQQGRLAQAEEYLSAAAAQGDGDEQVAPALAHVREARREVAERPRDRSRLPAGTTHDPRFLFANDDRGRVEALDEYKRLINDAIERSQQLFTKTPRAKLDVRRVPEFKEATAPGAYYQGPALDGSRPGIFFANLRDMSAVPRWSMRTLAYHEGVPGHHWQTSTAQELTDVPQFRKVIPFTAYHEGWALYSEWLAHDAHWYDGDSFGELGRLQAELFRAVRLVVDTGIHAKRWTRERAIDYMLEKTGMRRGEVTAEIERYIVNPGQACAYKIGMIKIQELRRHAETALGTKFDLREFHDAVLRDGALPLSLLEQQIGPYIESRKQ